MYIINYLFDNLKYFTPSDTVNNLESISRVIKDIALIVDKKV